METKDLKSGVIVESKIIAEGLQELFFGNEYANELKKKIDETIEEIKKLKKEVKHK